VKFGTQLWGLIAFVVSAGVLAAGWFLGVSPLLTAQAQAQQQQVDAASQNDLIAIKIAALKKQKEDLADYQARADQIAAVIPSDIEAADFIRSLNSLATSSNVQLTSITLGDPVPYVAPAATDTDVNAPNPTTDARINGDNFLLVPVTLGVAGGWNEVLAFTHGVQAGDRLVLVTTVNTSEDTGIFTTTLSGTMYVLIRPEAPASTTGGDAASDPDTSAEG
jgi:Tfp pilus assembly protein PilO